MSKSTVIMISALLLFAFPFTAGAWDVEVVNETGVDFDLKIYGNHLFWNQVDCRVTVPPRSVGHCQMPFLICPIYGEATHLSGWTLVHTHIGMGLQGGDILPACYNTRLRIFTVERLGHVYIEYESGARW